MHCLAEVEVAGAIFMRVVLAGELMLTIDKRGTSLRELFKLLLKMGTANHSFLGGVASLEQSLLWDVKILCD